MPQPARAISEPLRQRLHAPLEQRKSDLGERLAEAVSEGNVDAHELLTLYCALLYRRHGTYEEVAKRTKLDRRTVKKYVGDARGRA